MHTAEDIIELLQRPELRHGVHGLDYRLPEPLPGEPVVIMERYTDPRTGEPIYVMKK